MFDIENTKPQKQLLETATTEGAINQRAPTMDTIGDFDLKQ